GKSPPTWPWRAGCGGSRSRRAWPRCADHRCVRGSCRTGSSRTRPRTPCYGYDISGAAVASVEVYDVDTGTWSQAAPMPTPRGLLRVTVSGGRIYAIGGADTNGMPIAAVEVYHPAANRWSKARPLTGPREGRGGANTAGGRSVA